MNRKLTDSVENLLYSLEDLHADIGECVDMYTEVMKNLDIELSNANDETGYELDRSYRDLKIFRKKLQTMLPVVEKMYYAVKQDKLLK